MTGDPSQSIVVPGHARKTPMSNKWADRQGRAVAQQKARQQALMHRVKAPLGTNVVRPAVSGNSRCRKCKQYIPQGSLRVGVPYADYDSFKWYHPLCANKKGIKVAHVNFSNIAGEPYSPNAVSPGNLVYTDTRDDTSVWVKAGLKAADEHRKNLPGCECPTWDLVSQGCQCGAFEKEEKLKQEEVERTYVSKAAENIGAIFGPSAVDEYYRQKKMVDDSFELPSVMELDKQIAKTEEAIGKLNKAVTEMANPEPVEITENPVSILDKAVTEASKTLAEKIAPAKAEAILIQESITVGLVVYHIFNHKSYVVTEVRGTGYCEVVGEDEKVSVIQTALLTPTDPGFVARAVSLYEQNAKVRLVLWMSILLTTLFGFISTALLTTLLAG